MYTRCHFVIAIFISSLKTCGLFPIFKMADQTPEGNDNFTGMGRAKVLIDAIEEFCRRGRGQRHPSPPLGG